MEGAVFSWRVLFRGEEPSIAWPFSITFSGSLCSQILIISLEEGVSDMGMGHVWHPNWREVEVGVTVLPSLHCIGWSRRGGGSGRSSGHGGTWRALFP